MQVGAAVQRGSWLAGWCWHKHLRGDASTGILAGCLIKQDLEPSCPAFLGMWSLASSCSHPPSLPATHLFAIPPARDPPSLSTLPPLPPLLPANLLKPALARGDLHCIGATTVEEYRKHIEADAAFARRFQV